MNKILLALAIAALALGGCTTADTTNESTKEFQTTLTFNVSGGSVVNYSNKIETFSETDSDIATENDPSMVITPKTNLGLNGSPTQADDGSEVLAEGFTHGIEMINGIFSPEDQAKEEAVIKDETIEDALIPPGASAEAPPGVSQGKLVEVYEVDTYKDGRMRFLLRGTVEKLPEQFSIYFKGEKIFDVDKGDAGRFSISEEYGERWEADGRMNTVVKNSHGRKESITILLDQDFGSNPEKSQLELKGTPGPEVGHWHGWNEENNRGVWYFAKMMKDYPEDFIIDIKDCGSLDIEGNDGSGMSFDGITHERLPKYSKSRDVVSIRQSGVPPRGMVLIGARDCRSTEAVLYEYRN